MVDKVQVRYVEDQFDLLSDVFATLLLFMKVKYFGFILETQLAGTHSFPGIDYFYLVIVFFI